MAVDVDGFMKDSGFKILAMSRLAPCEYSVVLYLLNCAVSGLDQFITTEAELASLIGYDDETLTKTLEDLHAKNIIRIHYGDVHKKENHNPSLRVGVEYDVHKWVINQENDVTPKDAIVFPFRRQGEATLKVMDGQKEETEKAKKEEYPTWKRVFESFIQGRSLDDGEMDKAEEASKILVDTHPVDQVLLMLRHFALRIPTLSLLASSWQHYQEIFEAETQKVDLSEARQKHIELDQKVRDSAMMLLSKREELEMAEEELTVLQILTKHRHPRRQLFWAYQVRSRYPNLHGFFADNVSLMLPVTSGGSVVKRS